MPGFRVYQHEVTRPTVASEPLGNLGDEETYIGVDIKIDIKKTVDITKTQHPRTQRLYTVTSLMRNYPPPSTTTGL